MSFQREKNPGKTGFLPGRNEEKKRKGLPPFLNMGFSLLLVVLLTLTLVIFSLLALTEGQRDRQFAEQLAAEKTAYYEACSRSEKLRQQVVLAAGKGEDLSNLPVEISEDQVSWEIPVGEGKILAGACDLESGKLTRHQVIPAKKWNKENSVSLWIP